MILTTSVTDGSDPSPAFNLSAVTVPVALFHGTEDDLVNAKDYARLLESLPNSTVVGDMTYKGEANGAIMPFISDGN